MTIADRAFCVYVVVGSVPSPSALLADVNAVLRTLAVVPPGAGGEGPILAFDQTPPATPAVGPGSHRIR
jgi:hypothetical protein